MRLIVLLLLGLTSLNAWSEDRSSGCGFGKQVAPRKTLLSTTTADITNGILWPSYTFALTSGTSGCAQHDLVLLERQREHFIAVNIEKIKFEAALGHGENLMALSQVYGCPETLYETFSASVRADYSRTLQGNPMEVSQSINQIVISNPKLKACI